MQDVAILLAIIFAKVAELEAASPSISCDDFLSDLPVEKTAAPDVGLNFSSSIPRVGLGLISSGAKQDPLRHIKGLFR